MKLIKYITVIVCLSLSPLMQASSCKGHFVNPLTDICWDCIFPLTIGSSKVVSGSYPDTGNPKSPLCACIGELGPRLGISIGYWEPFALVDVTRKPYCMVNLGVQLNISDKGLGGRQQPTSDGYGAFYYVHWYKYPIVYWLQIIGSLGCMQDDGFDIIFPSELDPTWNDSKLAFITNPEATLFSHPIPRAACAADATKTLFSSAIDSLFWCQGSLGSTYPLTGFVANQESPIQAATLLVERADFKLHRLGAIPDSIGVDGPALCETHKTAIMPKSRYRYQMTNTIPDAKQCHPFGKSVVTWETGHAYPGDGDNFGFMIFRKRNCCFL